MKSKLKMCLGKEIGMRLVKKRSKEKKKLRSSNKKGKKKNKISKNHSKYSNIKIECKNIVKESRECK